MANGTGTVSRLSGWAAQPFSSQMNLWGWFLFTGLIIVIAILWTRVLRHIIEV